MVQLQAVTYLRQSGIGMFSLFTLFWWSQEPWTMPLHTSRPVQRLEMDTFQGLDPDTLVPSQWEPSSVAGNFQQPRQYGTEPVLLDDEKTIESIM